MLNLLIEKKFLKSTWTNIKIFIAIILYFSWILYEEKGFNPDGDSGVEYYFSRFNDCLNLKSLSGKVSSVRFAGASLDFTTDTFSIYEHTLFQGKEEYLLMNYSNLMLNDTSGSIIITGSMDWTVFDRPVFSGNSICLRANPDRSPVLYYDLENTEGLPKINYGAIKSVKQGCPTLAEEAMNALKDAEIYENFGKQ